MLQQLKIACALHLWARALAWLGLLGMMLLLLAVSGGFPPQAWIMLAQSLPLLGHLLAVHGLPALASFAGILLLSLTWGVYWAMLVWAGIGLLRAGRQTKRAPAKTNWRRNSADNLLEQGFDEPQASLAYAALTRAASPIPPPPSASLSRPQTGKLSQTHYSSGDPRGRHAPTNLHAPTPSTRPPAPSKMATRPLASTLPRTTGEY